ncbi:MAG: FliA/WhiG family RNA polymerase sigma factor [Candidatus Eisenbacteria bacterium]|uniref:FliA/WhiG family RNA polymerase sigma factor n=1 Tax=Eiseniibacteriota bacterium TaxID=2212470 RepID=A0A9D6L6K6_UNCEI|nr:FliA/WhiG family RNA polymerase sigma factor [Candidatus Eisenbacteria bacterium]MBI3539726.1 FliA/WhiG family RNA polymerase sigma factor [Candidatus Eisenbacteria bacterium]
MARAALATPARKPSKPVRTLRGAAVKTAKPALKAVPALKTMPALKAIPALKTVAALRTPARNGAAKSAQVGGVAGYATTDDLLRRFAPLVRHVVERVATTLPRTVDHEDLYSAGVLGLLDAHAKFDARKGVKFETYAVWRIRGAVLDQLRALDWVSRSMRRKARNLDGVTRKLDQKLGRAASESELAREMNMTRGDFYRLLDQVRGAVLVSLDENRSGEDQEPSTLADHLADPAAINLEERLEEEERKVVMLRTLDHLPEQERLVVALYYYEHLTLKEIGRALGISESRVSQVHTRAMSRLRIRLQHALRAAA